MFDERSIGRTGHLLTLLPPTEKHRASCKILKRRRTQRSALINTCRLLKAERSSCNNSCSVNRSIWEYRSSTSAEWSTVVSPSPVICLPEALLIHRRTLKSDTDRKTNICKVKRFTDTGSARLPLTRWLNGNADSGARHVVPCICRLQGNTQFTLSQDNRRLPTIT